MADLAHGLYPKKGLNEEIRRPDEIVVKSQSRKASRVIGKRSMSNLYATYLISVYSAMIRISSPAVTPPFSMTGALALALPIIVKIAHRLIPLHVPTNPNQLQESPRHR